MTDREQTTARRAMIQSLAWLFVALGLAWFVLMLGIVAAIRQAAR